MEIPRGRKDSKVKFLKAKYEQKLEFPEKWRGGRCQTKKPSTRGVKIFSGIILQFGSNKA